MRVFSVKRIVRCACYSCEGRTATTAEANLKRATLTSELACFSFCRNQGRALLCACRTMMRALSGRNKVFPAGFCIYRRARAQSPHTFYCLFVLVRTFFFNLFKQEDQEELVSRIASAGIRRGLPRDSS